MREKIKEIILEVRQHLCNTEFAPPPFDDEPLDCNWFNSFTDQILTLIREEIGKQLLNFEELEWGQQFGLLAEEIPILHVETIAQAQLQKILKALEGE